MSARLIVAGLIALFCVSPSLARPKGGKVAPRPAARSVNIENKRVVALLSFEILTPPEDAKEGVVLGKLEKPLDGGQSISLSLPNATGCVFEARWRFEDAKDQGSVDLCSDAHIVLID
jgi:hypothetical protein